MNDDDFYTGDPRHCPRHPSEITSSADGMFDAPCGACEAEAEADLPCCADCGEAGERTGHMGCQYPQNHG